MRRLCLLLCWTTLTACSTLFMDPLEQFRAANKRNLERVAVGHTRFEVESIMGKDHAGGGLPEVALGRVQYLRATNPMREEDARGDDGSDYSILVYYTDLRTRDDKITDDELTPVVLANGKVVGVGYPFLGSRVSRYQALAK